jgi:hypothetical protein
MPDFSRGTHIGKIKTSEGEWDVFKLINGPELLYGVKDQTVNRIVCFIGLLEWHMPYAMAKNAYTLSGFEKRGLATALMDFIVREQDIKVFSDFEISKEGSALWRSILKKTRSTVKIADLKQGQDYNLSDIGKLTPDGRLILDPEKDDRLPPKDRKTISDDEQQFVYLLEGRRYRTDYRGETTTSKFGLPSYVAPGKSILQEYVYYGPNIDMD